MALSSNLQVGLKEWAIVCHALEQGRQIILLRKGGIRESGGEFELEHRQFFLFPTYLHQTLNGLKPSVHDQYIPNTTEPDQVKMSAAGIVTDIIQVQSRAQMDALDEEHIWAKPLIDMRFNYRPENPLYLLLVRAYRLRDPAIVQNTLAYAGCKSWVPLTHPIATSDAVPVMDDDRYAARRAGIIDRLRATV